MDPDWRDAAAYAPLLHADRYFFAWEWLRRDPAYRKAAQNARSCDRSGLGTPHRFGLVAFECPSRSVPFARPLWRSECDPSVLRAERSLRRFAREDRFDSRALAPILTMAADSDGEHLLLSDGLRAIRLDGPKGTFSGGATGLRFSLDGLDAARPAVQTLRRLLALCRSGRFARDLHQAERQARRWILMLRAWDAAASGAAQRDIAAELLSRSATTARWRAREPSIRSQAQRLVRSARAFAHGGYFGLLR